MSSKAKVLVVDDEPIVCMSCEKVLSSDGHNVQSANTSRDALRKLDDNAYDLVIADIKIPDQNGLVLLRNIKAEYPETDVVMITGYPSVETAREAMKLGASDYLPKPLTPDMISDLVLNSMRRKNFAIVEEPVTDTADELVDVNHDESGSWVKETADGKAVLGFAPGAWLRSGKMIYVELPAMNENIAKGETFAKVLCSDGTIHELLSPVDGTVVEVNEKVNEELVASSRQPETSEWLMKIATVTK
jgi:CheY-like chemotaxis protein/glycine cleavage system H lipoate-binding protein